MLDRRDARSLLLALLLGSVAGCAKSPTAPAPPDAAAVPDAPAALADGPSAPADAASPPLAPPPLSRLRAGPGAPLYTTYAAPLARSSYLVDEGYRLIYDAAEQPLQLATDKAGSIAFAFKAGGQLVGNVAAYAQAPEVTRSYADAAELRYAPLAGLAVRHAFAVYSSRLLLQELTLTNTSAAPLGVSLYGFVHRSLGLRGFALGEAKDRLRFAHGQPESVWSETALAGYETEHQDLLLLDAAADGWGGYPDPARSLFAEAAQGELNGEVKGALSSAAFERRLALQPGQQATLRLVRAVDFASRPAAALEADAAKLLREGDLAAIFAESEALYRRIPRPRLAAEDESLVYWQAFTLARQMMLPAEGATKFNYYVFSREPTWGWGHDGQVFHESVVMLAYALMDPASAMDSQRVYFERQQPDGYVHYRIGPYVARDFPVRGEQTSSAPFFSWINWEVYQIAKDRAFLAEAYAASRRYVEYMTRTRDKDGDGLYEWGGNAVLECVRDGSNVIWDLLGYQPDSPQRVEALDLNCMLVNELQALAAMAGELGQADEATAWKDQAAALAARIEERMWDEASGFYYHVDKQTGTFETAAGIDLRRMEIIGFLPLWAGVASPERAQRLLAHLKDPDKFWRKHGVPTLAADDSYYSGAASGCCRWNGPIWFPWQYLVVRGLQRYGFADEAKELVRRNVAAAAQQLRAKHTFFESYGADSDAVSTISPYIWDGILARMILDVSAQP